MSGKKVGIPAKPRIAAPAAADDWVTGTVAVEPRIEVPEPSASTPPRQEMKRLTIDVSADLHTRIKLGCVMRGKKIADELRDLLEQQFPKQA